MTYVRVKQEEKRLVIPRAENKSLKEVAGANQRIPRFQKMAQEWVESPFTEFMIMLLLVLDLGLTIHEFTRCRSDASVERGGRLHWLGEGGQGRRGGNF